MPENYEQLLEEAQQTVAEAFERAGLDADTKLSEAREAAQADMAEALAGTARAFGQVVVVEVSDLNETNELLRQLLAREPQPQKPDYFMWALTVALLIVAILMLIRPQPATSPSTAPPPRIAPITHPVSPTTPSGGTATTETTAAPHPDERTPPGSHERDAPG